MRKGTAGTFVLGLAILCAVACGGASPTANWAVTHEHTAVTHTDAEHAELVALGDQAWAQRGSEALVRQTITAWNDALRGNTTDAALWTKLAQAQYFLANGYLAFDAARADEAANTYQAAITSATRALALIQPEFVQRMEATAVATDIEIAMRTVDARSVPALFWRSAALNQWARGRDGVTVQRARDEVRLAMSRVLELDRDYYFASADRFIGTFFAATSGYMGGDLPRARQHFEYSIARYPGNFASHVAFATEYAVKIQDRTLFRTQLEWVANADLNAAPELAAENRVEQRKANEALARIDTLFR